MKILHALRRCLPKFLALALPLVAAAIGCGSVPSAASGVATVGTGMPGSGGATLEARCQAGDGAGCRELGERYRDGAEPADVATIRASFERACELGDAGGCADFGMLLAAAPSLANERERAAAAFAKGCALGNAGACFQIVERAYRGAHGQESPEVKAAIADALAKSEASCAAATPGNCSMAAHLLRAPGGADAARADALERRAHEFSERACDAGTAASCVGLAEELRRASKGPADLAAVAALLKRACDAGSASGCDRYGYLVDRGVAAEKGEERALMLYRRSCDLGDPSGCYSLGDALHDGKGAAADADGARQAFARAGKLSRRRCEAGLVFACTSLLSFLDLEVDVGFAASDAVSLVEAVCLGDQAFVCDSLGRLLEKGNKLVAKDEARAEKLRARACAVGGAPFCPETDPAPASVPSLAGIPIWDRAARLWCGHLRTRLRLTAKPRP